MSTAPSLQQYLAKQNIEYDVVTHEPTMCSTRTAQACHVSGDQLAKAIVLRHESGYILAVLPASHHAQLPELAKHLGGPVELARETDIDRLFQDCVHGAVPPVGQCYGLPTIVDSSMDTLPDIYMEAGDHETLLHMDHAQFARLMADAGHGHFSEKRPLAGDTAIVWG